MNRFETDDISQYKRIYKRGIPDRRLLVFVIGIIVGMAFFYISGGSDITLTENFWESSYSVDDNTGLYQYVFALRFKQFLFLMICSFSYIGNFLVYGLLAGLGFGFGLILFTFAYNFKFMGIIVSVAMAFPQGIFYLILFLIVFDRCFKGESPSFYKEKSIVLWKTIMCVILFMLGFLCETCINYEIMKKLLITILN
jgi:hypothetical protein